VGIRIVVLGDICPAWGFSEQFATGNAEDVFHDILPLLQSADIAVANMEAPATDTNQKLRKNSVNLKAKPTDIAVLKSSGIDGVALANNHILDYGTQGLEDTVSSLDKNGVFYFGLSGAENYSALHISDINGYKIGFLAFAEREFNCAIDYGTGAVLWDDLESPGIIRSAKSICDYLIIQYHGGIEHYVYPSPYLQKKCRAMADAGADFVTCQHSHIIGSHEKWNGSEILYGQGNAIFGANNNVKGWNEGLIAKITFGEEIKIEYIPIKAHEDGEYLATDEEAEEILGNLEENSKNITDPDFIQTRWNEFCKIHSYEYLPMAFARGRVFNKINRVTKGRLIYIFTNRVSRRNAMNLIRCDAHKEVLQTILENDYYYAH